MIHASGRILQGAASSQPAAASSRISNRGGLLQCASGIGLQIREPKERWAEGALRREHTGLTTALELELEA